MNATIITMDIANPLALSLCIMVLSGDILGGGGGGSEKLKCLFHSYYKYVPSDKGVNMA